MYILLSVVVLLPISLLLIYFYALRYYVYKKLNITGPRPVPIFGSALELCDHTSVLQTLCKYITEYSPDCKVSLGLDPYILVSDHETVELITTSKKFNEKGDIYRFFFSWLGTGLLTSTGKKWYQRRKIITPTFHFQILNNFVSTFESVGDILIEKLNEKADGKSFDIFHYIRLHSLDVVCETAMGTKINALTNSESLYVRSVKALLKILTNRGMQMHKNYQWSYVLTQDYWEERKLVKYLHNFTYAVINRRREQIQQNTQNLAEDEYTKRKIAFLDMLFEAKIDGLSLSIEDIREEVDTFMFEGHDTTSSAISFGLYIIAQHPMVQKKIIQEQYEIFDSDINKCATYDNLQNMRYLDCVIKEVLRLCPSVPLFSRIVREDIKFKKGTIRAGSRLAIFPYGMHRKEEYFPEPLSFKPERFFPENISSIKPFTYIPFTAGERNCIGQKFAMLDIKSTISKVLRNFELIPDPKFKYVTSYQVILKSENGLYLKMKKRKCKNCIRI